MRWTDEGTDEREVKYKFAERIKEKGVQNDYVDLMEPKRTKISRR